MSSSVKDIDDIINKIEEYFKFHNITVIQKTIDNPNSDRMFNLFIQRSNIERYQFNISYFKSMKTFLIFNVTMALKDEDKRALDSIKAANKALAEQFYMSLRKVVYPLNVDFEIDLPRFMLTKEITMDSVSNEQFFMDQIHNFLHAIELIRITFDEFFFSMFPKAKSKDTDEI